MADLTTLANVKGWLSLTQSGDDPLLSRLITAASGGIEQYCGRTFASASYTETRNGDGKTVLFLRNTPIQSVTSVVVNNTTIQPLTSPTAAGYTADETALYLQGCAFWRGLQNVTVQYTAGYATTPTDIEQACIEWVALRYKERERIGHVSKSIQGETVSYTQKDMPDDVRRVLSQYTRNVPLQ